MAFEQCFTFHILLLSRDCAASYRVRLGRRNNFSYRVCGHVFLFSLSVLILSRELQSDVTHFAVCLCPNNLSHTCIQSRHSSWNLIPKRSCFCYILSEKTRLLCLIISSTARCSEGLQNVESFSFRISDRFLLFRKRQNFRPSCQAHSVSCEVQKEDMKVSIFPALL